MHVNAAGDERIAIFLKDLLVKNKLIN
jgi:hypothetical protein